MKIKCDNEDLMEIDDFMVQLLQHDLLDDVYEDVKRRLKWIIEHKCDQIYSRIEAEWLPILRNDPNIDSIPKSKRDFCKLVFSHKDYKNRAQREAETT